MMMDQRPARLYRFFGGLLLAVWCLAAFLPSEALGASVESKYYAAEKCYLHLKKNPKLQKYRDRWLGCINKFMAVHRHAPRGKWASAGLYQAAKLYAQLYQHSYYAPDKKKALKLFDRVIAEYPKSSYRRKARDARKKIASGHSIDPPAASIKPPAASGKPPAASDSRSSQWLKKADKAYRTLQRKPKLKKYRDQWLKCIEYYRKAYQADPDGATAAAALFGIARSYAEMAKYSFKKLDRTQSRRTYEQLVKKYPDSPYAPKARAELGMAKPPPSKGSGSDGISDVIKQASGYAGSDPAGGQRMASARNLASVEGLRFWTNPRYTRVVIDADKDTVFSYHELREDPTTGKPQRIYIDVHNSRLGRNLQKVVPINDNLLSDARAGQYTADKVRVVVDIKSFKTYKIFSLKNPFRIVLDVWGISDGAPRPSEPAIQVKPGKGKIPAGAIAKQLALGVRRIVIDPGHGGKDYGAPGYLKGVHEKKVVLAIAKRLQQMVRSQLKCEAVLTRSSDKFLSLEERTAMANTQDADLFVSIHTNASSDRRAHGIETYILNLATDDEAIRVAARENATSTKNISDLDTILESLMNNAKVSESTRLASYVQQSMYNSLRRKYKKVRSKGIKQAPFYVLLGANMPSILIETSFISNPTECKRLVSKTYQKQLCQGIIDGIRHYIKETNPTAFRSPANSRKGG
jgi:N-acetylmuramoyl-L-alanine amidase